MSLIEVTVRDRAGEAPWGSGGLYTVVTETVKISADCRVCGRPRGERQGLNQADDGNYYWVQTWVNPCGHQDMYADVMFESVTLRFPVDTPVEWQDTTGEQVMLRRGKVAGFNWDRRRFEVVTAAGTTYTCGYRSVRALTAEEASQCASCWKFPAVGNCCTAHGIPMCHGCYRGTHFVEVCTHGCALCAAEGLARLFPKTSEETK